jgi:hypothetical protein
VNVWVAGLLVGIPYCWNSLTGSLLLHAGVAAGGLYLGGFGPNIQVGNPLHTAGGTEVVLDLIDRFGSPLDTRRGGGLGLTCQSMNVALHRGVAAFLAYTLRVTRQILSRSSNA